jgi:hypothetical protein
MDVDQYEAALANLLGDVPYSYEALDDGHYMVTVVLDGRPNWMPIAWQNAILEVAPQAVVDGMNIPDMEGVIVFHDLETPAPADFRLCARCFGYLINNDEQRALHDLACYDDWEE